MIRNCWPVGPQLLWGSRDGASRSCENSLGWFALRTWCNGPAATGPECPGAGSDAAAHRKQASRPQCRAGDHAARHCHRGATQRRFPGQQDLDQPVRRARPDGRAAVRHGPRQGADAVARRDLAAERHPQRAGRHDRRGRRRHDRQQLQHRRLLGPHRHLSRRHARPRPVLSRRLRSGCDRSPVRACVAAVRPRLDRGHHQSGDEEADPEEAHRAYRLRHHQRPRARHGRREHALR